MTKKFWPYIKAPTYIFFSLLLLGFMIGYFIISPHVGKSVTNLRIIDSYLFWSILRNNMVIIAVIYISIVFTNKLVYFSWAFNGLLLGIIIGWIFKTNIYLLLLIIPHGLFEIPNILATGYIAIKGEIFARTNFKKFIIVFFVHEIATVICALIEGFITPYFQILI